MTRTEVRVALLGRFTAGANSGPLFEDAPQKAKELLAYLVLNRGRPHSRDALARLLWPKNEPERSRKYLRQTLWQLQRELRAAGPRAAALVERDSAWIRLGAGGAIWADTEFFESAHHQLRGAREAQVIEPRVAKLLGDAVSLYRGELLDGWSHSWCLSERDRFHGLYLSALACLTEHFEAVRQFEAGIAYATKALDCDHANERIHRRLMRLLYLSGDRIGALRQFERCRSILREELDVDPSEETLALEEMIRAEKLTGASGTQGKGSPDDQSG